MDVSDLVSGLDVLARTTGHTLSVEHRAALQSSLLILKRNLKLSSASFWGKIVGVNGDYFVAQGFTGSRLDVKTKRSFVSTDCTNWVQLPEIDASLVPYLAQLGGRFSGEPAWAYKVKLAPGVEPPAAAKPPAKKREGDDEGVEGAEADEGYSYDAYDDAEGGADPEGAAARPRTKFVRLTEEQRLAYTIDAIDFDTVAVPRGAYVKTATDAVVPNPAFEGLPLALAQHLHSYLHLRPAVNLYTKTLLEREKFDVTLDFMDPLDEDAPIGAWAVDVDLASSLVTLRSLVWPGAVCHHTADSRRYGAAYFGTGEKNWDLPFML
eukprot:Amastigsp_a689469_25.p1 type:complete len:322 gc:universal Amastigsp_a689469_25:1009-44(-)